MEALLQGTVYPWSPRHPHTTLDGIAMLYAVVGCPRQQLVLNAVREMPSRSFRTSQKKENKKDSILATVKYKRIDEHSRQQNRKVKRTQVGCNRGYMYQPAKITITYVLVSQWQARPVSQRFSIAKAM